jgi:tetratricopeptide (TPR) repeat protein
MFTVTFYSYKGGVGRTSALMNVSHHLSRQGKRVCILDFDLEAPGLDAFEVKGDETPRDGLVEYISHFMSTGEVADLDGYIQDVTPSDHEGKLFLIPAGRKDSAYQASLSKLDWKVLYKRQKGFLFIEALRRAIESKLNPDYLLIDSRTGLTDISGICTVQLPDLVVLLFGLNNQNLLGTAQVYKTITSNKLSRSIQTLLVASPIPEVPESFDLRARRFERATELIGASPDLTVPYDPFICFQETIADVGQSQNLIKAYGLLARKIISLNSRDVINLLRLAFDLQQSGELQLADLKYREILGSYSHSVEAWNAYGKFLKSTRDFDKAASCFRKVLELAPKLTRVLAELATTELQLGQLEIAREHFLAFVKYSTSAEDLTRHSQLFVNKGELLVAAEGLSKAVSILPDLHAIVMKAEVFTGLKKYDEAYAAYKEALHLAPSMLQIVFNAGYTALASGHADGEGLLRRAIEIFETTNQKSEIPSAWANIVGAISFAFEALGDRDRAVSLLEESIEAAQKVEGGKIFSFPQYEWVDKELFISQVETRLHRLKLVEPQSL